MDYFKVLFFILFSSYSPLLLAQSCDSTEVLKILDSNGASGDYFGRSVSINGNSVLIGAPLDDTPFSASGAAIVFENIEDKWVEQAKLIPDDAFGNDQFGFAVSLQGNTALVSSVLDDDQGTDSGSVYVFTRSEGIWTQQAKLLPEQGEQNELFGYSVSLYGDTALIGAPRDNENGTNSGSAYIFERSNGEWNQLIKILPADGATSDQFGDPVSLHANRLLIGAYSDDDSGFNSGSVYAYEKQNEVWTHTQKLNAKDGSSTDLFGFSISQSENYAIIGALHDRDNGSQAGSAYVFSYENNSWTQHSKLLPNDGEAGDRFGIAVAISEQQAIVGADWDDDFGSASGAIYQFILVENSWTENIKITTSDASEGDYFGSAISIVDDTAVCGAYLNDDNGSQSGSAYIFNFSCLAVCPADLINDGNLNFLDVSAFLSAFSTQDPIADFQTDGSFNFLDVSAFLTEFGLGCP